MNEKNIRLVTAESVRAGHPDKFCDQVADAILDAHLRQDLNARVAVEVFATAGKMIIGGEITSKATVSYDKIVAGVINRISYTMSDLCGDPHELLELEVCLHEQSPDISAAVDKTELGAGETLGAGDQGIMVGYATNETEEYLPLPVVLAHRICKRLDELKPTTPWLGADGKAQVAVAYENDAPVAVTAVTVDTFGTGVISDNRIEAAVKAVFDLTPAGIIRDLKLNRPIYSRLACYGHFGRTELELPWEEINRKYELLSAALKQSARQ